MASKTGRTAPTTVSPITARILPQWVEEALEPLRKAIREERIAECPPPPTNLDQLGALERWERENAPRFVNC